MNNVGSIVDSCMLGPPAREPGMNEDERKHLMLMEHRRREEIKRLLEDNDDNYLDQVGWIRLRHYLIFLSVKKWTIATKHICPDSNKAN